VIHDPTQPEAPASTFDSASTALGVPGFRIAGVYYWQGHWNYNFWTNVRTDLLEQDFRRIRGLGCNTVFLQGTWGVFQTSASPPAYDDEAYAVLQEILEQAQAHGLYVAIRLGTSERLPLGITGSPYFVPFTILDDGELEAFYDLYRETAFRLRDHDNLLCLLFSWEDLYGYPGVAKQPLEQRQKAAHRLGAFRDHLERTPLEEWNQLWKTEHESLDDLPFPEFGSPEYAELLRFLDERLLDTVLPRVTEAAHRGRPDVAISYEVRVDRDPIPTHLKAPHSTRKKGFSTHECTFVAGTAPFTSTYFSVAWNAKNKGDVVTPARALANLRRLRRWLRRHGGRPVFFNQFNFVDTTPAFAHNSRLADEQAVGEFLEQALRTILDKEKGYAFWSLDAYEGNVVDNCTFQRGLEGWEVSGTVEVLRGGGGEGNAVRIADGGSIAVTVHAPWNPGLADRETPFTVRAHLRTPDEGRVEFGLETSPNGRDWTEHQAETDGRLRSTWSTRQAQFPVGRWVRIRIRAHEGTVDLADVSCSNHVQEAALYRTDGSPIGRRPRIVAHANRRLLS